MSTEGGMVEVGPSRTSPTQHPPTPTTAKLRYFRDKIVNEWKYYVLLFVSFCEPGSLSGRAKLLSDYLDIFSLSVTLVIISHKNRGYWGCGCGGAKAKLNTKPYCIALHKVKKGDKIMFGLSDWNVATITAEDWKLCYIKSSYLFLSIT